jgi:NADH-quinone oxidoreductase subunit N
MFKLLFTIFHSFQQTLSPILFGFGVLSICFGILGAISEKVLKRFFVYSSMGHVGFMLAALSVFSLNGSSATFHYLFIYMMHYT